MTLVSTGNCRTYKNCVGATNNSKKIMCTYKDERAMGRAKN